jgi:hypothetical protein
MLTLKLVLLIVGGGLAIGVGPFRDGDAWPAILTGLVLVSAMAIQNAAHRIHKGAAPPTTLMTGTTTQLMIDAADAIRGLSPQMREASGVEIESEIESCTRCGGELTIIASIEEPHVIAKILSHLESVGAGQSQSGSSRSTSAAPTSCGSRKHTTTDNKVE